MPVDADLLTPLDLAVSQSGGQYKTAAHLELMQREVFATILGDWDACVLMAPPRHGKSEFLSRWVPTWLHSSYPQEPSIITSYSIELARNHSRWVRDSVNKYSSLYGNSGVREAVSAASDWEMHTGKGMKAAGVGGGITGRGAKWFIIDDPLKNAEQAISSKVRDAQWEWFQTTAMTRIEPGGKLFALATRWHEEDLLGRLLKFGQEDFGLKIRELRLPALAEPTPGSPDPLGRQTDEPLWPQGGWDRKALDKKRAVMEPYWWNALFQQRLGAYGKNEWPDSYFYGILAQDDEWPERMVLSATALDPSKGKNSKSGDYSAIVNVGYHDGFLWVDCDMDRRPVPKMIDDLVEFNFTRRPTVTGIEAVAFQELLGPSYISACSERGYYDDPVMLENTVNKELRIGRLGFWLRLHRLKIRNNAGGKLLLKQLKEFPNSEHDDGPDALEMAVRLIVEVSTDLQEVAQFETVGEVLQA